MVDFEEKMKDIISDYYSTIGKFNNVSNLILSKSYLVNENDSEETQREKEGQRREILVDLGRVAEMAFKYLIKIRRMELFPNEPYNDSVINGNVVKGFKDKATLSLGVVKDLGNKVHASKQDIEEILNFSSVGPKAHDFSYLYLIIDKLMPDIREKVNEITILLIKSNNSANVIYEEELDNYEYIAFPNKLLTYLEEQDEEQQMLIELIEKRNETIFHSGDIFTRLRYYSNNPFDKSFDVAEVYKMVTQIVYFIKLVHLYNEKISFNSEVAFSYSVLSNYPNLCRFTENELRQIYMHDRFQNNPFDIMNCMFFSNLTLDEIFEIVNSNQIKKGDYSIIFAFSLNLKTILYFRSNGIIKYEDMVKELTKKTSKRNKKIFNMINENRYTLEEYKELSKRFNSQKNPRILTLLDHLQEESIMELVKYPKLLSFFINEFYPNVNVSSYQYNNKLFKNLLLMKELQENPKLWYALDVDQIQIYSSISKLLINNPLNDQIINKRNLNLDTIIENIGLNIEYFKDNPFLLYVIPIMLDHDDNKEILNILMKHGLDINKLEGFDSTIFCFPLKLVRIIVKILDFNKIPLIVENKVNPVVMRIISMISKNYNSNLKLIGRRILYNIDHWHDLKLIDDLNGYILDTPQGKRIQKFEEKIMNTEQSKLYNYINSGINYNNDDYGYTYVKHI